MKNFIKSNKHTNWLYVVIVVLTGFFVIGGILIYQSESDKRNVLNEREEENEKEVVRNVCLSDDEFVEYEIGKKKRGLTDDEAIVTIFVKDKKTGVIKFDFQIDDVRAHSRPIEVHKCGAYIVRRFNYDYKKTKQDPGSDYRQELWRYDYGGEGEMLVLLAEKPKEFISYYSTDFRVDLTEAYIAFDRGYLGHPDYAIVIKDLQTKEDVFVLTYDDLINKYSASEGNLRLGRWRDNGESLWGNIHIGARELACFSIEKDTWETKVFHIPDEASIVESGNETGEYISYNNGPGWIGVYELALQIYEEWREQGKQQSLIIYNLFTKERIVLETIDDPSWHFESEWISNTELEYEMPNGEKKSMRLEIDELKMKEKGKNI